ncbi:MAG: hypothetical protein IKY99_02305 [Bacteroidaceae bacterium]|nr:hypothetical protein [Bacteroidaceae bacterium]MBR5611650.1 hypothetical protein [Bacteroidaceae bacterium]
MHKLLVIICVCLLGGFTCWKSLASDTVADDLFLKNVEALADEEFWGPYTYCEGTGNYTCPGNGARVEAVYEGFSLRPDEETY